MTVVSLRCIAFVFLVLAGTTPAHAGDLQAATATLEACISEGLPAERQQASPSVDRLLDACRSELGAVQALLPQGAIESVTHQIRHRTDELLRTGS